MNELHTIFVRLALWRRWAWVLIGSCAAGFYEKKVRTAPFNWIRC